MILLWNLNDLVPTKGNVWRAVPEITADIIGRLRAVARELKQYRRALVVVGGFAEMWGLDSRWDDRVHHVRRMLAHEGILTITGAPLYQFARGSLNSQQQHFVYSESLCQQFLNFFDECVARMASATVDLAQKGELPYSKYFQTEDAPSRFETG